jgi:hypothetical protein
MNKVNLETLLAHLDDVAMAGVIDKDSNAFYDHLHKAIEIVERMIHEQDEHSTGSGDVDEEATGRGTSSGSAASA